MPCSYLEVNLTGHDWFQRLEWKRLFSWLQKDCQHFELHANTQCMQSP